MAEVHGGPQGLNHTLVAHEALERAEKETGTKLQRLDKKLTEMMTGLDETIANMPEMKRGAKYRESIRKIQAEAQLPRFVIGVLGDTGCGKSSLINAVLDESHIVPTNCMRACTAVITEILWNSVNDAAKRYRAELHRDILDADGKIYRDIHHLDSDSGTAYAILRAVYTHLSDEELERPHPTALASHPAVRQVLGSTLLVEEKTCDAFYSEIQSFVDSEDNSKSPDKMAYWPLIKVVRVFLKSEVLSTGVPGGRDSNTARAAVSTKYIKECTRLWVVADINRAVDDKTAKTLMEHNFKQQLKYDGSYSSITFICTKADHISLDEAAEALGITDDISKMYQLWTKLKPRIDAENTGLKNLEFRKMTIKARSEVVDNDIGDWRGICGQAANGERTFRPFESPRKRKRQADCSAQKKQRTDASSDTEDNTSDEESDIDAESKDTEDQRELVTVEEARAKLEELQEAKKSLKEKKEITRQIREKKAAIATLTKERSEVNAERYRRCIQGRNNYSREEIQKDFACGLKEFDDELLAEQENGQEQQQQQNKTNYDEIRKSLPVFCVSSRGYQQLRGRMKEDQRVVGFSSLEDTQVLELRKHTLELAASVQDSCLRRHIQQVNRLLRGMDLFLSGDDPLLKMSEAERNDECQHLEQSLLKLGKELPESLNTLTMSFNQLIAAFHQMMRGRRFLSENSDAVRRVLKKHIAALDKNLVHISQQYKKLAKDEQRGANRLFKPSIENSLRDAYNQCTQVRGSGAFQVMRELMEDKVESEKDTMFDDAATDVENAIKQMLRALETMIRKNMNEIVNTMSQDYTGLIGTAATAADKRDRKILKPILNDFYGKIAVALNAEMDAEVDQDADVAYYEDDGDSEGPSVCEDE
ncbi:hypothetical protein CSOJ01_02543 [Colletotrichum sojae]|uniref:Nuclear GTPase SLIP-GC n=1 Tax=Colletotrichum sojae TaxID=2175907 RepID=A0A8H6JQH0_9PEZI|nr:hypothetical protein CSOJ01_02543 [Colletotrichum sojae]